MLYLSWDRFTQKEVSSTISSLIQVLNYLLLYWKKIFLIYWEQFKNMKVNMKNIIVISLIPYEFSNVYHFIKKFLDLFTVWRYGNEFLILNFYNSYEFELTKDYSLLSVKILNYLLVVIRFSLGGFELF